MNTLFFPKTRKWAQREANHRTSSSVEVTNVRKFVTYIQGAANYDFTYTLV